MTSSDPRQNAYLREVRRRSRRATLAVESRLLGLQVAWAVALAAGAAVSVALAFAGDPDSVLGSNARWITALLGFVVVVAQGADRLLGRTSEGARTDDVLRRTLTRERRLFDAREGPYKAQDDPFGMFVERVEAAIGRNDEESIAYTARLLTDDD